MIKEAVAWEEKIIIINISFIHLLFLVVVDIWSAKLMDKCGNYILYRKINKLTSLLGFFSLI